jgi:hypothetical protein
MDGGNKAVKDVRNSRAIRCAVLDITDPLNVSAANSL